MEADKNEFNIYRQPSLSDIITMPPSETTNSSSKHSPQLTQEYVSYYRGKAGVRANNHHSIMLHRVEYKLSAK
jgi:hypothetical protein